ncbi:hypothetical protein WMF39_17225 [Sorangium sp. So ce1504]|uniref:hypothetical protein n=1 Tax=Sorangium sp. So ce1504 TaxID=3133337 RepID=UPI003F645C07
MVPFDTAEGRRFLRCTAPRGVAGAARDRVGAPSGDELRRKGVDDLRTEFHR